MGPLALDQDGLGLKPVACEVFHGLIFVSLADNPASFDQLRAEVDAPLAPFSLDRTRIAHCESYEVQANWKLLVENWQRAPLRAVQARIPPHPPHPLGARIGSSPSTSPWRARGAAGHLTDFIDRVGPGPCPPGSVDYSYSRHSLYEAYDTGSDNGKPVAPLLGSLQGYDQGAMDPYVGFLNPLLVYNDHAVIYRFIPIDRERSVQEILWLVHEDAEEGRDYDLQRLTWLWDATTKADKHIIEKNQKGVNSRFYQPGPLAEMEVTQRFINYYLERLARWTTAEARPEETELMTDEEMLHDDAHIALLEDIWGEGFVAFGGPDEVARVLEGLDLSGKTVLDIGCGSGAIAVLLLARDGWAGSVVGIDVEDDVRIAAARLAEKEGVADRLGIRRRRRGRWTSPIRASTWCFPRT